MRVFAGEASGAAGAWLVSQLIGHGQKVTGTYRSPGNAARAGALGAEPVTLGQQPARVRRRIAGGS